MQLAPVWFQGNEYLWEYVCEDTVFGVATLGVVTKRSIQFNAKYSKPVRQAFRRDQDIGMFDTIEEAQSEVERVINNTRIGNML